MLSLCHRNINMVPGNKITFNKGFLIATRNQFTLDFTSKIKNKTANKKRKAE